MINKEKAKKNYKIIQEISGLAQLSDIELIAVLYDLKPTMGELVNFDKYNQSFINKLNRVNELCKKLGFKLGVSNCKFIVNSPRGIFEMVEMNDKRKGKISLGVSKDMDKALEGIDLYYKKTLDSKDSRKFGEVMGYPECCLDFGDYLCLNSRGDKKRDPDNFGFSNPAVESLKRSKNFAWQLNVFSHSLLSHYPCSLECQPSIKFVNDILRILKVMDLERVRVTEQSLKEPASLYWTCADKILLYGDFEGDFKNSEIKYHKSESQIESGSFYQENDERFLKNLKSVYGEIERGDRLVMTPQYFEIYKDKRRIKKIKKENQYIPVLVKPNR
ncbi:MAG: hypothetical protein ABH889_03390 [Candidatus Portnoybacteria bacterium]